MTTTKNASELIAIRLAELDRAIASRRTYLKHALEKVQNYAEGAISDIDSGERVSTLSDGSLWCVSAARDVALANEDLERCVARRKELADLAEQMEGGAAS